MNRDMSRAVRQIKKHTVHPHILVDHHDTPDKAIRCVCRLYRARDVTIGFTAVYMLRFRCNSKRKYWIRKGLRRAYE